MMQPQYMLPQQLVYMGGNHQPQPLPLGFNQIALNPYHMHALMQSPFQPPFGGAPFAPMPTPMSHQQPRQQFYRQVMPVKPQLGPHEAELKAQLPQ